MYNLAYKAGTCDVAPKQLKFGLRIEPRPFSVPLLKEYGLPVRLASAVDGVPEGVEYQPLVRARSDADPVS